MMRFRADGSVKQLAEARTVFQREQRLLAEQALLLLCELTPL
jgi:hypothetical protein